MTLRTFFAFSGLVMTVAELWFLILFRPPGGFFPYSRRAEKVLRPIRSRVNKITSRWNARQDAKENRRFLVGRLPRFAAWKPYPPTDDWAVGARDRIRSLVLLGVGLRLFYVNVVNADRPLTFSSWVDASFATFTIGLGAVGCAFSTAVYLRRRKWED